jgi:hypothetical protein
LEVAAQFNVPTEIVRSQDNDAPAAIAANPPQSSIDLSALAPLAFVAAQGQALAQATPVGANSFFYAVTSTVGSASQPNTLSVIYEDGLQTNQLTAGQHVADMTLPLVVLSGGVEREVPATLQFFAACTGMSPNCITATTTNVTGNFSGKGNSTVTADQIGLNVTSSFGTSQFSTSGTHLFIQVDVPLILSSATDPLYVKDVNSVVLTAFLNANETGFTPKSSNILGPKASIGMAPYSAPLCPGATCSASQSQFDFSFCARRPDGKIAVAAFAAIANSGEALASTPLVLSEGVTFTCPF